MDVWLANSHSALAAQKSRKREGEEKADRAQYPLIEAGAVTSATLQEQHGRLEWATIVRNDSPRRLVCASKEPVLAFPPTRPAPTRIPPTTISQRAEQGAHFLRMHYPEVDISGALIREHVAAEAQLADSLQKFDPYVGACISAFCLPDASLKRSAFVAFPTGENASDLNVSEFEFFGRDGVIARPSARVVETFQTPMRQVVAADNEQGAVVGVRTHSATSLFRITAVPSWTPASATTIDSTSLASFTSADLNGRQVADVQLASQADQAVLVNDRGHVYRNRFESSVGLETVYDSSVHSSESTDDPFWRACFSTNPNAISLASARDLTRLDVRARAQGVVLYSVRFPMDCLTGVECGQEDQMTRVVTTSEIVWIDERNPGRPVMAFKHGREFDRTLQCSVVEVGDANLTVLSSRKNSLLTVYDVSHSGSGLVQAHAPPYDLRHQFPLATGRAEFCFARPPPELRDPHVALLRMSDQGSIYHTVLALALDGISPDPPTAAEADWSPEVHALEAQNNAARADPGNLGARDAHQLDLRPLYRRLFNPADASERVYPEPDPEGVYQTLENMPTFFQDADLPAEQILTTFDIAFRSGEEPSNPSRADFLTRSALSSRRGYRALVQGRIPMDKLAKAVPWHRNIARFVEQFVPDVSSDMETMEKRLKKYDLAEDDARPGLSLRREADAREQLALDLALSLDVYSPQPFVTRPPASNPLHFDDTAVETMSRAAEAMSIDEGARPVLAPAVQFGFLNPMPIIDHYAREEDRKGDGAPRGAGEDMPAGVRLLLSEWDVGADPESYAFHDPYGDARREVQRRGPSQASAMVKPPPPAAQSQSQQRPPPIVSVAQKPPLVVVASLRVPPPIALSRSGPVGAGHALSQDTKAPPLRRNASLGGALEHSQSQSQEPMTSTQIEPGPFGGRQSVGGGRKKPVKKRLGGF
ncbi:hypothetical protein FA95DRAFT_1560454 [Auriscalpium vulgare]|uniref:Uncharacterized protein n=1 Tax=Auriscalpium vulgare TaxID=40419 RepID=A0ACB8RQV4_9AGAM|nr:hypothetical protein FA95DRAFT_1560454 [Auriscalpium vulgare]